MIQKISTSLLFFFLLSFSLSAQYESQEIAAAKWKKGKYTRYNVTKNMQSKFYEEEVQIMISDGKVKYVLLSGMYRFKPVYAPGTEFVVSYAKNEDEHLYFTGNSIVYYDLDKRDGSVEFVKNVINEKVKSIKKVIAEIDEFRAETINKAQAEKDVADAAEKAHRDKYSIYKKELEKISIELISADSKIDCNSEFTVGFIAHTNDGSVIKSKSLGGQAYDGEFYIDVYGAKNLGPRDGEENNYFKVDKYCETMQDKQVVVVVKARYGSTKGVLKQITSCVPDPVLAAKAEAKLKEKKEREIAAAKQKEENRIAAEARAKELKENGHAVSTPGAFKNSENKWGIKDANGKIIVPCEYDKLKPKYTNGLLGAYKNNRWGFIDKQGAVVIPFIYHDVSYFTERGYSKVKSYSVGTEVFGVIDKEGKIIVPICYTYVAGESFKKASNDEYYIKVRINKRYGLVDEKGKLVLNCIYTKISLATESSIELYKVEYKDKDDKRHLGTAYGNGTIGELNIEWDKEPVVLKKMAREFDGEIVVVNDLDKTVFIKQGTRDDLISIEEIKSNRCYYINCWENMTVYFYNKAIDASTTKLFDVGGFDKGKVFMLSDVLRNNGISVD